MWKLRWFMQPSKHVIKPLRYLHCQNVCKTLCFPEYRKKVSILNWFSCECYRIQVKLNLIIEDNIGDDSQTEI